MVFPVTEGAPNMPRRESSNVKLTLSPVSVIVEAEANEDAKISMPEAIKLGVYLDLFMI